MKRAGDCRDGLAQAVLIDPVLQQPATIPPLRFSESQVQHDPAGRRHHRAALTFRSSALKVEQAGADTGTPAGWLGHFVADVYWAVRWHQGHP